MVRFTEDEKLRIEKAAKQNDRSTAGMVRWLTLDGLKRLTGSAAEKGGFDMDPEEAKRIQAEAGLTKENEEEDGPWK